MAIRIVMASNNIKASLFHGLDRYTRALMYEAKETGTYVVGWRNFFHEMLANDGDFLYLI
jgi:hypothetical protein